jgi:hypothetical protein
VAHVAVLAQADPVSEHELHFEPKYYKNLFSPLFIFQEIKIFKPKIYISRS